MRSVVFTGAAGPGAAAVIERVVRGEHDGVATVLATLPMAIPGVAVRPVDLTGVDLDAAIEGADAVVHLGAAVDSCDPGDLAPGRIVAEARAVLDAAVRCGTPEVVVVSSAVTVGALASNPVPLTEQAVVHPNPGCRAAVEFAEIERLCSEKRGPDHTITVLRSAPVVTDGEPGWLAAALRRPAMASDGGDGPGLQFLHTDDLASAITTVLRECPGGVVHVAPDGSLGAGARRELLDRPWRRVTDPLIRLWGRLSSLPAGDVERSGIDPYLTFEWTIANDRLRSLGWAPTRTNEEAFAVAFTAPPWSMLPSGRRQELLVGGAAVAAAVVAAGAGLAARRRHR